MFFKYVFWDTPVLGIRKFPLQVFSLAMRKPTDSICIFFIYFIHIIILKQYQWFCGWFYVHTIYISSFYGLSWYQYIKRWSSLNFDIFCGEINALYVFSMRIYLLDVCYFGIIIIIIIITQFLILVEYKNNCTNNGMFSILRL